MKAIIWVLFLNYTRCLHVNKRMPQGGYRVVYVSICSPGHGYMARQKACNVNMTAFIYLVNRFLANKLDNII